MPNVKSFPTVAAPLALALACLCAVPVASAEDNKPKVPSATDGKALAQKLCVNCHIVDAGASGTAPVGPPPFPVIANRPGQTAERVRGMLIQPHPPMPDIHLTNEEINDIVAYLDSLRASGTPPLLPPGTPDKPKLPSAG